MSLSESKFTSLPQYTRVQITLDLDTKHKFLLLMKDKRMSQKEAFTYLVQDYYTGHSIESIKILREKIQKRIKEGINKEYLEELRKIERMVKRVLQFF